MLHFIIEIREDVCASAVFLGLEEESRLTDSNVLKYLFLNSHCLQVECYNCCSLVTERL